MNWYKYCQEEWRWDKLRSWVGTGAILGLAALLAITVTTLREEYAKNPQIIERKLIEYKKTITEPNIIEPTITEPNIIEPDITEPNDINIDIDKIWFMESSRGTHPDMERSESGARGHFQFMKKTWNDLVPRMEKDWDWFNGSMDYNKSSQVAEYYLNDRIPEMLNIYKIPDTIKNRLGAYDWGIGHLEEAWEKYGENWLEIAPQETKDYMARYR